MARGYMGKILFVDLTNGKIEEEPLEEKLCRDYMGGYGIGAKILFDRQKPGVDPLGPDNILGFVTGPATGTMALVGSRYTAVGKSPLTGTWGDGNSGGYFGANLKRAGYDALFVKGLSDAPVYLFIDDGKAELRDATHLWGEDTREVDERLKADLGKDVRTLCIGPAGEKLSLISCPVDDRMRTPARSGLGAVMGAKRLKAIAVRGTKEVPVADPDRVKELRKKYWSEFQAGLIGQHYMRHGTAGQTEGSVMSGDAPVKNWTGVGSIDFPNAAVISDDAVIAYEEKKYRCWGCPVGSGGIMRDPDPGGPYSAPQSRKPEYETLAAFGSMTLNDNLLSLIKANDICTRYGLDTISAGCTIAFAIECYENGLITKENTDGLELTWGNHEAIVALTEKMAKREGFGEVLADGAARAAERIGKGADQYAIHVHGQEVAMHDGKYHPGLAMFYKIDATPGRHTQGGPWALDNPRDWAVSLVGEEYPTDYKYNYPGKGELYKKTATMVHVVNSSGLCYFSWVAVDPRHVPEFLAAITGWDYTMEECFRTGEKIANIRHAFNIREGLNPLEWELPGRVYGDPPLKKGPLAGITVDVDTLVRDFFKAMDWDLRTGAPSEAKLLELGMEDVARELKKAPN